MEKYHCHKCGKSVEKGEVLCKECYKGSKHHLLLNILGFLFGLSAPIFAIFYLSIFGSKKIEFSRWTSIGLIIPIVSAIIGLVNLL